MKKIFMPMVVAALAVLVPLGITATPAYAQGFYGPPICGPGGLCLNAWNGGPYVKTYTTPASNENFEFEGVDRCGTSFVTTANCPIPGVPAGLLVGQFTYGSHCVGDLDGLSGNATASVSDTCNSTVYPGTGGSYGTIFVLNPGNGCPNGYGAYVSAHWTSYWSGEPSGLGWTHSSGNGQQVYINQTPDICLTD